MSSIAAGQEKRNEHLKTYLLRKKMHEVRYMPRYPPLRDLTDILLALVLDFSYVHPA
jgi:hypothetical protein